MKHDPRPLRRAIPLLLAAAALPSAIAFAQEAQSTGDAPTVELAPPVTSAPVDVAPAAPVSRGATTAAPAADSEVDAASPSPPRPATRAPARTAARAQPAEPITVEPMAAEPTSAAATIAAPVTAPSPAATSDPLATTAASGTPEILPEPAPVATDRVAPPPTPQQAEGSVLPLVIVGLLAVAGLAFLLLRRRRRAEDTVYEDVYEEVHAAPAAPMPVADTIVIAPSAATAAAPIGVEATRRPWLDLQVRPVRAGVEGREAKVEFALDVANQGDAPARDVRVSTWMFPAGANQESEMERLLIARAHETEGGDLPPTTIDAGAGARIEATVALATGDIDSDAVLPVVVAEARYRLPDGSEGRTAATFAVGVPDGEELAHFDLEHPSGLHESVEARRLGEAERA
ncbi:LPXTG cell wall anchor domain-containing protein [Sphingosinicella sp. BN140058]|uniref:LPXTG cell wall anchor domain-containing protein n=1 Tax=Sphingosinicella sp. BN140058 TaxID=1892855 RepID=UPI001011D67C|nr:LPXTG cell wall anchor domain-containing protein [Sphingosinicella sp. BN140058]QAY75178.1 LPXTG cell wall anchor domain-containing protein [Sphingosinicella sp. BN140058]